MKKALSNPFLLLTAACTLCFGQKEYPSAIQKGSVLTGGSVAFSFGNSTSETSGPFGSYEDKDKYSIISFTPTAAVFAIDGLALGLAVSVTSSTTKDEDSNSKYSGTSYSLGPVIRYYSAGGFFVTADIKFGKTIGKYSNDGGSETQDSKSSEWQAGIGYAFFLNSHVSIEPSLVYRNSSMKFEGDFATYESRQGEFVIGLGFSIFLHKRSE